MIAISTILICDGGCGETFGVDNQWRNGYTQRKEAKEQEGWKFIKGKDYCPKCASKCVKKH